MEEQSPARPEWKAHMIAQHPPDEAENIIMRNRIFGLIAVGGCKIETSSSNCLLKIY